MPSMGLERALPATRNRQRPAPLPPDPRRRPRLRPARPPRPVPSPPGPHRPDLPPPGSHRPGPPPPNPLPASPRLPGHPYRTTRTGPSRPVSRRRPTGRLQPVSGLWQAGRLKQARHTRPVSRRRSAGRELPASHPRRVQRLRPADPPQLVGRHPVHHGRPGAPQWSARRPRLVSRLRLMGLPRPDQRPAARPLPGRPRRVSHPRAVGRSQPVGRPRRAEPQVVGRVRSTDNSFPRTSPSFSPAASTRAIGGTGSSTRPVRPNPAAPPVRGSYRKATASSYRPLTSRRAGTHPVRTPSSNSPASSRPLTLGQIKPAPSPASVRSARPLTRCGPSRTVRCSSPGTVAGT